MTGYTAKWGDSMAACPLRRWGSKFWISNAPTPWIQRRSRPPGGTYMVLPRLMWAPRAAIRSQPVRQGFSRIGADMYLSRDGLPVMVHARGKQHWRPGSGPGSVTPKQWQYWKCHWRSSLFVVVTMQVTSLTRTCLLRIRSPSNTVSIISQASASSVLT